MKKYIKKLKNLFSILGPGLTSGAADDDPSGIATYSQAGSMFGFKQLWTAFFTFPMMYVMQLMCGKIALVSSKGLAQIIKENYSKQLLYFAVLLLIIANTINIGADVGAMAAAANLLIPLPCYIWTLIIIFITLIMQIFIPYKSYAKYLKYLTLFLFTYIITAFIVKFDLKEVLYYSLIPHIEFTKEYFLNILAIFGTTISPYLFFWQANQEVEELRENNKLSTNTINENLTTQDIKDLKLDTQIGMGFSNIIMWFIILTAGATLHKNGITQIETAQQAALALKPLAGNFAFLFFSLGIFGTGLLAVPILSASSSYAICEILGIKASLDHKWYQSKIFYGIIIITTLIGSYLNFLCLNPITALYYAAILNGILVIPLIFIVLKIANNKDIMGKYINSKSSNIIGYITGILLSIFTALLIYLNIKN